MTSTLVLWEWVSNWELFNAGLAGVLGQLGLDTESKSSWNEERLAAPGEPKFDVLGVDGCDKWCLAFGGLWLLGMSDDAQLSSAAWDDAVDVWLTSSIIDGGCGCRIFPLLWFVVPAVAVVCVTELVVDVDTLDSALWCSPWFPYAATKD